MPSAGPSRRQEPAKGSNRTTPKRVDEGARQQGVQRSGFSAGVPISNGRGRPRAAPFGIGPWDGARVASPATVATNQAIFPTSYLDRRTHGSLAMAFP